MRQEFTVYPAQENIISSTATINIVASQMAAAGLAANAPVRVTIREERTYVPVTSPVPPRGADIRGHSTDFHRAAQSAVRGKEDALRELGKW